MDQSDVKLGILYCYDRGEDEPSYHFMSRTKPWLLDYKLQWYNTETDERTTLYPKYILDQVILN